MLVGCGKEKPQEAFDTYVKAWNKQKFADMYDQLSKCKKIFQRKSLLRNMKNLFWYRSERLKGRNRGSKRR